MTKTIILEQSKEVILFPKSNVNPVDDLEIIVTLPNIASSPFLHIHPKQTKRFEAIDGELVIDLVSKKINLKPGEYVEVKPNTAHTCQPLHDSPTTFKITYSPSLNFEYILTEMFKACNRNRSKHATLFEASYIMAQTPGEYYVSRYPIWLQRIMYPLIAKTGKILGRIAVKDINTGH